MPHFRFSGLSVTLILIIFCFMGTALAKEQTFSEFAVDLPDGWSGDEKSGFSSGDKAEYMLVLGKMDSSGDAYVAQVSAFVLPNKNKVEAQSFAKQMADKQADATEPRREGPYWIFTGDPRDNVVKGMGTTRVAADDACILIVISKDPSGANGADAIAAGLKPLSERTRALLQK